MKRFVIFLGFGPLIGYLVLLVCMPFTAKSVEVGPHYWAKVIEGIPFAYALGLLPALAAAVADWLVKGERIMVTTLVGLVASSALMVPSFLESYTVKDVWLFGIVGAPSALACSWLSNAFRTSAINAE